MIPINPIDWILVICRTCPQDEVHSSGIVWQNETMNEAVFIVSMDIVSKMN